MFSPVVPPQLQRQLPHRPELVREEVADWRDLTDPVGEEERRYLASTLREFESGDYDDPYDQIFTTQYARALNPF